MRSNSVNRNKWPLAFLGILTFLLSGCFEAEEGCLDPASLNFGFGADEACAECCNYPTLSLSFRHKIVQGTDTLNLEYNSTYTDDFKQAFAFDQIAFYLSNVHLLRTDNSAATVDNLLDLPIAVEGTDTTFSSIEDNFALVDPSDFRNSEMGNITFDGSFSAIEFTIGVEDLIHQTEPSWLPEDHPLSDQEPITYDSLIQRYIYNQISFFRDSTLDESSKEVIEITESADLIKVTLPLEVEVPLGYNVIVTIEVNYGVWFQGVDVQNDNLDVIKTRIVSNIAQSFSPFSVTFSR